MKLIICWGDGGGDHHDCAVAHKALLEAGYNPEIQKARGQEHLPKFLQFKVRREVHILTGSYYVPVLILDDGTAISRPEKIAAWAKANPEK